MVVVDIAYRLNTLGFLAFDDGVHNGNYWISDLISGLEWAPKYISALGDDIIIRFLDMDSLKADCDLIITAEGGIDYQTPCAKTPSEVARRARRARVHHVPVVALTGTIGEGAGVNYDAGIRAYASTVLRPMTLEMAIEEAE